MVFVVFGFLRDSAHRSPGGGRRGLPEKQEVGVGEKQKAGDPASLYKRAGVAHFLRLFVVVFVSLLRCVLDNFISTLIHHGYPDPLFSRSPLLLSIPIILPLLLGHKYREHLQ